MIDFDPFILNQTSEATRKAYARDMRVFIAWCSESGCDPLSLDKVSATLFRDYLSAKFAPSGAARVWNTVRSFYRYNEIVSPLMLVKAPKRIENETPEVPTDAQIEALLGVLQHGSQEKLIIALLLNGLRASEVRTMEKTAIYESDFGIVMRVIGKGNRMRVVPSNDFTVEAWNEYKQSEVQMTMYQLESDFLVPDAYGEQRTLRQIEWAVEHACNRAGLKGIHPHSLRHHYATRLSRAGIDIHVLALLLGHKDINVTRVYITMNLGPLREATNRDPINRSANAGNQTQRA